MFSLFPSRTIVFTLGPVAVHWYGIMYVLGFLIGIRLLPRLLPYRNLALSRSQLELLFVSVFFGVLLGGRLGFVLFYGLPFYARHPAEIFVLWHGGMSSHGGFLGVLIALLLFTKRCKCNLLALTDVLVFPIAIGLALGRVGNLINGELYGTITTVPWGMHFPGAEGLRHPTQIYAILKDLLIALICAVHLTRVRNQAKNPGSTTALFLITYALLRCIVEYFRDQPYGYESIFGVMLSKGQLLTVPLFVLGIMIWFSRSRFETH